MRYRVRSGVLKLRFWSALGSNFNCCTALGIKKSLGTGYITAAQLILLSFPNLISSGPLRLAARRGLLRHFLHLLVEPSTRFGSRYGMLQQKFQLKSWELRVLRCKGVETVAVDYDKHCRTRPNHQQPRQLKENCFSIIKSTQSIINIRTTFQKYDRKYYRYTESIINIESIL